MGLLGIRFFRGFLSEPKHNSKHPTAEKKGRCRPLSRIAGLDQPFLAQATQ